MFPIARVGDGFTHDMLSPCGLIGPHPVAPPTVSVEGQPAASVGCTTACSGLTLAGPAHPPPPTPLAIVSGSGTVTIGGFPAARWSPALDLTGCGASLGDLKFVAARTTVIGT